MDAYEHEYLRTLERILASGVPYSGRGTIPDRKGLWQVTHRIPLTEGGTSYLPLITTRRPLVKWMVEELRWMLSGTTFEPHLTNAETGYDKHHPPQAGHSCAEDRGPTIWKEWATKETCSGFGRDLGELGPIYGHSWRNAGATPDTTAEPFYEKAERRWVNAGYRNDGVDQLARLLTGLEKNPFGTRHILSGWIPSDVDIVSLPPCHTLMHFCVRDIDGVRTLSSFLYQRSADYLLGVPANMAFYCLLTHLLAKALGYQPGEFVHTMGDCHLYGNQFEAAKAMLSRTPLGAPEILELNLVGETPLDRVLNFTYDQLRLSEVRFHDSEKVEVNV